MADEKRLIDANAFFDKLKKLAELMRQGEIGEIDLNLLIASTPTVDAVEVVRCKDCKKWRCHGMPFDITKGTCHNPRFHFHHGHVIDECFMPVTNETDFCSYGERRNDV